MDTFTPIDLGSLATETKGTGGHNTDNLFYEYPG